MQEKLKILAAGFMIGAVSFILFHISGCTSVVPEKDTKTPAVVSKVNDKEEKSCCSSDMDEGELSENSVYQLDSKWINQSGRNVKLSDYRGKEVVLTMFFASCTYACPVLVNDMKRIEAKLSDEEKRKTEFILISIDTKRDTPEALNEFAKKYNLDLKRWTLLTGKESDIQDLAAVVGFKYVKEENGDFSHSNLINILDKEGEVVFQHKGLNQDVTAAAEVINNKKSL